MKSVLRMPVVRLPRRVAVSRYKVPNLERGLQILELLVDHPAGLQQSEIATLLRCSKTSVYRITMTLLEHGYLNRNGETRALSLSRKLVAMGCRTQAQPDLMGVSVDVLKRLRDRVKETVLLGTLVGTELVVLEQVLGTHPFKFSVDLGTRLPLHTAAPGKAILAFLPAAESEDLLRRLDFTRYTERTLGDAAALREELSRVVAGGHAVDRGEQLTGIHCVAAPVLDRHGYPVAAIWVTGPSDRLAARDLGGVGKLVAEQARVISNRLGYGLLEATGGEGAGLEDS